AVTRLLGLYASASDNVAASKSGPNLTTENTVLRGGRILHSKLARMSFVTVHCATAGHGDVSLWLRQEKDASIDMALASELIGVTGVYNASEFHFGAAPITAQTATNLLGPLSSFDSSTRVVSDVRASDGTKVVIIGLRLVQKAIGELSLHSLDATSANEEM